MQNHILSIILFTPLVGAFVLLFVPKENKDAVRWIANIFALVGFLISLPLVPMFWAEKSQITLNGFHFLEGVPNNWIPSIGAGYNLGIDGISFLLIMLTTMLGWISILSSWTAIEIRVKEYYIWFLVLQTGMLGVFMSLDFFLFFVFWEAMLVPMYLLIGIWGGPRKLYAAIKFFLYTLLGSVMMLLAILFLYFDHHHATGVFTFSIPALYATAPHIPFSVAIWLFLAFFLGFAIKVPMFPFHTWLPDAHVEAPTAGSVILAGVLLKMGTYGFIRFSLPFFPQVIHSQNRFLGFTTWGWMAGLSVVGIIYGALVSLMQKDMKKLVAYSSVSHLGFCTLGIFCLNQAGLAGSVLQQINHGISTGALFLIVGILYERRHTREIAEYGGISNVMPVYATITMIMFLSSMGLPLLNGFVGEFTILQGAFTANWKWAAWAAPGVILAAAYLLWLYQRVFFGTVTNPKNEKLHDLTPREILTFAPLVICAFWIGLYPKPFFEILETPVNQIVANVNRGSVTEPQPMPLASMENPSNRDLGKGTASAVPNAEVLPGNLQEPVILSGATVSRSEAVAQSKDPYPLNSAARRQGILPVLAPANSQGQGTSGAAAAAATGQPAAKAVDTQAKAGN